MRGPAVTPIKDVIAKFRPEVLERFDFTKAEYHGALVRMTGVVCPEHGPFNQYVAQFRYENGSWCPACGDKTRRAKQRLSTEEFISRATADHNGRYTYERTVLNGTAKHVIVSCPDHGDFEILPNNHMLRASGASGGQGCPKCGAIKRGHRADPAAAARVTADTKIEQHAATFEKDARAVHGDKYDYSKSVYRGRRTPMTIICPDHGPFKQNPDHHLDREHGCPECSHHRSKGEAKLARFVSIFAEPDVRGRQIIAPKELDIYLPEHKLAIEYCGEYWHAARSIEDEVRTKDRHVEKLRACAALGIRLLTIYESEWHNHPTAIKRLIRNAMGKGHGRVMARKCDLRRVGGVEATNFMDLYHPQGGSGYGEHFGLYHNDKLVACMRFTLGANDRGTNSTRVWTLSRYATRIGVTGGASRLFKAFLDSRDPDLVKSFSDNRYFTGEMYPRLGFALEADTGPDYQVWHQRLGLMSKSTWQRKDIPARIRELGSSETFDPILDPRTEREMTYLLGARRIFDCGKKRWVWRKPAL